VVRPEVERIYAKDTIVKYLKIGKGIEPCKHVPLTCRV
jgi:hypothetical protein